MKYRVLLNPDVPADLEDIMIFLEQRSLEVADRFINAALGAFDDLGDMPGRGSPKSFGDPRLSGIRTWRVPHFPDYLIYYRTVGEAVRVLAVLHGARDLPAILRKRT